MDTSKPLLSGLAATIVGTVGTLLAATAVVLPSPWGFVVGLVGFLACALAGMSARPPAVTEGSPVIQGAALAIATTVGGLLVQFWPVIPVGWPQSIALAAAALISWLTGHALPMLGATPALALPPSVPFVADSRSAAEILTRAGR